VKDLLLRGLDPRNTVNQLTVMLAGKAAPKAEAPPEEKPAKKSFLKKKKSS
jgi:hypothetical protein